MIRISSLQRISILISIIFLVNSWYGNSQIDSTKTQTLPEIVVQSSRVIESKKQLPLATTVIDIQEIKDVSQQLSFNEYLSSVSGLMALNANNFSQDLRVSIRGFGARSAFGIRGVKIIVDGIPETTPDGQGQIDNLNLASISRVEVIKGPSSTLYGNASGGVINVITKSSFEEDFIKAGTTFGNYDFQRYQLSAGFLMNKTRLIIHETNTTTNGYREQSGFKSNNLNLRLLHDFSDNTKLNFQFNYTDSPYAEDAGGLTLEELNEDRRQARARNVDYKTEEAIDHLKIGTSLNHKWSNKSVNAYGFYANRNFYGLLPFENGGIIDLGRNYFGVGSSFNIQKRNKNSQNTFQIGFDLANQSDDRDRFRNMNGDEGDKTLGQKERFKTLGFYALNHFKLDKFLIRSGIRYDINKIEVTDMFLDDGDQSGNINLDAFNPSIGISYEVNNNQFIYTNFSTSFETPVLSELSAVESNEGGFNTTLEPQKARNFEIGYKVESKSFSAEMALFHIATKDDITSYEIDLFPGRTFYRNAGKTKRNGLEFSSVINFTQKLSMSATYTYSDFKYDEYTTTSGNFDGNRLPGIPKHMATLTWLYNNKGLKIRINNQYVGELYANDSNMTKVEGYLRTDLNIGYDKRLNNLTLSPFIGVNNLFNTEYNDNIRINAFGSRFYEPAPKFNIYGGMRLRLNI
ncbi:TonB-dependent receptor [Flavobacteriaceae sp. LMIT009]